MESPAAMLTFWRGDKDPVLRTSQLGLPGGSLHKVNLQVAGEGGVQAECR